MVGFTREALANLFSPSRPKEGHVPIRMMVFSDCCHLKKEEYGELWGSELENYAAKLVKEKQTHRSPLDIVRDERLSLTPSKKLCHNYGGRPAKIDSAKNAKKLAKALLLQSYGLSRQGNSIGNIFLAGQLIMDKDVALRRKIDDYSNDYRGILRSCIISAGDDDVKLHTSPCVKITLFNKTQVTIFHHAAKTGRMTLHLDGTKFEADLGIKLEEGVTMLHHIGSINGNAFVVGTDDKELL